MSFLRLVKIGLAALSLVACQYNASISRSDEALNEEAEAIYRDLLAGEDEAIVARMSAENDLDQVRSQLPMLREMAGHDTAPEPVVLGSTETTSNLGRFYLVEQTYAYPDRDVHIATQFHREDEAWRIHAFNLTVRMTGAADEQVEVVDGPVSGLIGEAP